MAVDFSEEEAGNIERDVPLTWKRFALGAIARCRHHPTARARGGGEPHSLAKKLPVAPAGDIARGAAGRA